MDEKKIEVKEFVETTKSTKSKVFSEASEKPRFDRQHEALIFEAKFETDNVRVMTKTEKDKSITNLSVDKQYISHWLKVVFQTNVNDKVTTFNQTFGTIREYDNELWTGTSNRLTNLYKLSKSFLNQEFDIWELGKMVEGKMVLVKSEDYDYAGNKGFSNVIQDFVDLKEVKD